MRFSKWRLLFAAGVAGFLTCLLAPRSKSSGVGERVFMLALSVAAVESLGCGLRRMAETEADPPP